MPLALCSTDLAGVQRITRTLLSPLDYPTLDGWRRDVCRQAKELLGADLATFQIPNTEATLFFSEEIEQEVITSYPDRMDPLDQRFNVWERKAKLGVCDRAAIWGPHLDEYERGTYFQEFVVPARGFDAIILASALDHEKVEPGSMATLMFHHASPRGPRFGSRGLDLLRLLQPAFEAGVRSYRRFFRWREDFCRLLDTFADGVLLLDANGRVVHQNTALTRMLTEDAGAAQISLRRQMETLGRRLVRRSTGEPLIAAAAQDIDTGQCAYTMRTSLVAGAFPAEAYGAMVVLERRTPKMPSAGAICERFKLTPKEAQVCLLLGRGKSNDEIARELFISPHTARRHTEHILYKLKVRSRAEVGPKLLS
jgi:DNA-binding CsgD family transcriptional regulator